MITTRRLLGCAGVLVCFAVSGGGAPTAAGQNPAPAAQAQPVGDDDNQETLIATELAAAHAMVEYGLKEKKPLAVIAGIDTIWRYPADPNKSKAITVEGATKDNGDAEKEQLLKAVKAAQKMAAGDEAVQTIASRLVADIEAGKRGTANGSTKWSGIVLPTDKKADAPIAVVKRTFIGGKVGKITVTKDFNTTVPLNLKLYDPSGNLVPARPTNAYEFEFKAPAKDGVYKLEIRNYHTKGVLVDVVTN